MSDTLTSYACQYGQHNRCDGHWKPLEPCHCECHQRVCCPIDALFCYVSIGDQRTGTAPCARGWPF